MITVNEIDIWRKNQGMTLKDLAGKLNVSYKAFCPVMSGKRKLSAKMAANIEKLMSREAGVVRVSLAAEFVPMLQAWANTAGVSIDDVVQYILSDALKNKVKREAEGNNKIKENCFTE